MARTRDSPPGLLHPGGRLCLGTYSRTPIVYPPRGRIYAQRDVSEATDATRHVVAGYRDWRVVGTVRSGS